MVPLPKREFLAHLHRPLAYLHLSDNLLLQLRSVLGVNVRFNPRTQFVEISQDGQLLLLLDQIGHVIVCTDPTERVRGLLALLRDTERNWHVPSNPTWACGWALCIVSCICRRQLGDILRYLLKPVWWDHPSRVHARKVVQPWLLTVSNASLHLCTTNSSEWVALNWDTHRQSGENFPVKFSQLLNILAFAHPFVAQPSRLHLTEVVSGDIILRPNVRWTNVEPLRKWVTDIPPLEITINVND